MKVQTSVEKIKYAIMNAERVTGKNLTLPILSSILIIAAENAIKIRATNLSLGIELSIPAKVEKEGVVAVSGTVMASFFSTLGKDDNITLIATDTTLSMTTSSTKVIVKCLPYDDFPTLPTVEGNEFTMPVNKFVDGLKNVAFSASYSEVKPELASVYMYSLEDMIVFVATDSFRLAEKKVKSKNNTEFNGLLIPIKNCQEIVRIMEGKSGDVKIISSKNQISLSTEGMYLTSRLIDGVFPDYKQIIPKSFLTEAIVLKQDLLNALKISNLFSDKFNQITLRIDPKKKVFELDSKNADIGETTTNLAGALKGDEIEVNCNQKYFIDAFQSLSSDSVALECNQPNKPIVIKGVGDQSFMYLVMPMNR